MAGFMGDSSEGTFRKATGSVFPDCFIIGATVQSSEGSQCSCNAGLTIIESMFASALHMHAIALHKPRFVSSTRLSPMALHAGHMIATILILEHGI